MQIRLARTEDLSAINAIYNQAVRKRFSTAHLSPVSMEYREMWFDSHGPDQFPVFVADSGEKITGWVSLGAYRPGRQALARVAEVSYYVEENERGKGVGSLLLGHAVKASPSFHITILIAILLSRNPASIALLEKFGFSRWGSMPGIAKIDNQLADHLYYGLTL